MINNLHYDSIIAKKGYWVISLYTGTKITEGVELLNPLNPLFLQNYLIGWVAIPRQICNRTLVLKHGY
jgi:hypothetical protein